MSLDKMAVDKKTYSRFVRVFRPNRFTSLIYACVCVCMCVYVRERVFVCVLVCMSNYDLLLSEF